MGQGWAKGGFRLRRCFLSRSLLFADIPALRWRAIFCVFASYFQIYLTTSFMSFLLEQGRRSARAVCLVEHLRDRSQTLRVGSCRSCKILELLLSIIFMTLAHLHEAARPKRGGRTGRQMLCRFTPTMVSRIRILPHFARSGATSSSILVS